MKWLKSRTKFINEAKIKDVILPRQSKQIKSQWGEEFLEQEEVTPTDKIKQGSWVLSKEDKNLVLGEFFSVDMDDLYKIFQDLPDKFCEILKLSIDTDLLGESKFTSVLKNFDIKEPSVDEIYLLYENVFRKLAVGETKATEVIERDDSGRPIMGNDSKPLKISKNSGDPIFSKNLVNINSFITDFNNCYPEHSVDSSIFRYGDVENIRNAAGQDFSSGSYKIDFEIFKKDLILQLEYKPSDILNISISKFYSSCQHLYTGGYRSMVLSNIFDPNSIPAFLKFDTPIYWEGEKISDQLPLARMQVRSIEGFESDSKVNLYFDRCYPDRLQSIMEDIVTKYSGNENNFSGSQYLFTPDIPMDLKNKLSVPYMDKLELEEGTYIGVNVKTLYLSKLSDWSRTVISPKAKIKEVIIETTQIPSNMLEFPFDLDWIKFKFLKINDLEVFKFKTKAYGFDKCKFDNNLIKDMLKTNPNVSKLSFISCDVDQIDFMDFKNLEELELIYTLDINDRLDQIIGELKPKILRISGDLLSKSENKKFIQDLKKSGVKVEIIGPVI